MSVYDAVTERVKELPLLEVVGDEPSILSIPCRCTTLTNMLHHARITYSSGLIKNTQAFPPVYVTRSALDIKVDWFPEHSVST